MLTKALQKLDSSLPGSKTTKSEIEDLAKNLPAELLPTWLTEMLQKYALSRVCFSIDEDSDKSGLGAELIWFTAEQIIDEALRVYPGIAVTKRGYLPIGGCMIGSGDPYFLKMKDKTQHDAPLVRIYHDLVRDNDEYPESEIETVCDSLSDFFNLAKIEPSYQFKNTDL